ncbi:interleukin-6 receptor subunit alpha [Lampris incognitus]|uniref:interleukin-6 receptor subunit alpha n=1 Tax=Lampris incognitus TaxID=2546036 RepID=UPI0024B611E0|nr:interleukin-6 receptor subunit alpha [Lampris incognitus]
MRTSLALLGALCACTVRCVFQVTCLRKDPPPGVLVLPTGSRLALTCGGHMIVDGVKTAASRDGSLTSRAQSSDDATPTGTSRPGSTETTTEIQRKRDRYGARDAESSRLSTVSTAKTVTEENGETTMESGYKGPEGSGRPLYTHPEPGAPPLDPTVQPTSMSTMAGTESDWWAKETDVEEEEEEEYNDGVRVTTRVQRRLQWRRDGRTLKGGENGLEGITFDSSGTSLSLPSVTSQHSGRYSCHHKGGTLSSFKVIVADPPERPTLSCYKRSPSSKIRCEWMLQSLVTMRPHCYLFISTGLSASFSRSECSYSPRLARCWCALDYDEEANRVPHMAYLCVTSAAGNATSALLEFTPLSILKPDPPSALKIHLVEGHERRLRVTWGAPSSWKRVDDNYELDYEISYRPSNPPGLHGQNEVTKNTFYTITDALPGVEYIIKLRAKDEYDGLWSNWSTPVYARSWTAQGPSVLFNDDLSPTTPVYPFYDDTEGSGADDVTYAVFEEEDGAGEVWQNALWISALCGLLSVILAAYVFRHKKKFVSKLQKVSVFTKCRVSSPVPEPAPTPQEGQALVTFTHPRYKEPLPNEVEENGEEGRSEGVNETMQFNNESYFLVQTTYCEEENSC